MTLKEIMAQIREKSIDIAPEIKNLYLNCGLEDFGMPDEPGVRPPDKPVIGIPGGPGLRRDPSDLYTYDGGTITGFNYRYVLDYLYDYDKDDSPYKDEWGYEPNWSLWTPEDLYFPIYSPDKVLVTAIGKRAFGRGYEPGYSQWFGPKYRITSINLPKALTRIESQAFGERGLMRAELNNVKYIGQGAFNKGFGSYGEPAKRVVLPDSLEYIDENAFESCYFEELVIEGSNITHMGLKAFGRSSFGKIDFGRLRFITKEAFKSIKIKNLVIGDYVQYIDEGAFQGGAFGGEIETLRLGKSLSKISFQAFSHQELKEITIPASVDTIEAYCFNGNKQLQYVRFEGNVKNMSETGIGVGWRSTMGGNFPWPGVDIKGPGSNGRWKTDDVGDKVKRWSREI